MKPKGRTQKKLSKIEKKLAKQLRRQFKRVKGYAFIGDVYDGRLFVVVTGKVP